jgi:hypothetical protein
MSPEIAGFLLSVEIFQLIVLAMIFFKISSSPVQITNNNTNSEILEGGDYPIGDVDDEGEEWKRGRREDDE